jgi:hypothetical protein
MEPLKDREVLVDPRRTWCDLAIGADAARIQAIEAEKSTLDADDPRMVELSAESARLAQKMVPEANVELDLANEARRA